MGICLYRSRIQKDARLVSDIGRVVTGEGDIIRTSVSDSSSGTFLRRIPGHGPLATLDDLREFHGMLRETIGMVRQKRAAGQTLEQIQNEGVPEEYATWGSGFINTERWLEIVHRSISDE